MWANKITNLGDNKKETHTKLWLVTKRFQEQHNSLTDSTTSKTTLWIMLSWSTVFNLSYKIDDAKAASLQSHTIERAVFLEPPPQYQYQGKLWKLNGPVYRLTHAFRKCFVGAKDALDLKTALNRNWFYYWFIIEIDWF